MRRCRRQYNQKAGEVRIQVKTKVAGPGGRASPGYASLIT